MKILIFTALAFALCAGSVASADECSGNSGNVCFVYKGKTKKAENYMGPMNADAFFSAVAAASSGGQCSTGKISNMSCGRVYANGQNLGRNLTNAGIEDAAKEARQLVGANGCTNYICYEVGPEGDTSHRNDQNPPKKAPPTLPTNPGGGSSW